MKIHDVEQNSEEWLALRSGIPTSSEFGKIVTSAGKASTQADKYMLVLLAEWLVGGPVEKWEGNQWTDRGKELEGPEAVAYYELTTNVDTHPVGFVTRDDGLVGCSPDRFVSHAPGTEQVLLEIKCPAAWTHVDYLLRQKLPTQYKAQVQGQLYICEGDWCDFLSYYPGLSPVLIRVDRDEAFITALKMQLGIFLDKMLEQRQRLTDLGHKPT